MKRMRQKIGQRGKYHAALCWNNRRGENQYDRGTIRRNIDAYGTALDILNTVEKGTGCDIALLGYPVFLPFAGVMAVVWSTKQKMESAIIFFDGNVWAAENGICRRNRSVEYYQDKKYSGDYDYKNANGVFVFRLIMNIPSDLQKDQREERLCI